MKLKVKISIHGAFLFFCFFFQFIFMRNTHFVTNEENFVVNSAANSRRIFLYISYHGFSSSDSVHSLLKEEKNLALNEKKSVKIPLIKIQ